MNQNLILRIVGVILCIEALCMIPPLLLSVFGGGVDQRAFLYALLICGGVGVLLSLIRADNTRLQPRDGFVCVALCWIALSVFGALPYFFSGSCSFIDAIFETVSGLTTTGASSRRLRRCRGASNSGARSRSGWAAWVSSFSCWRCCPSSVRAA